MAEIDVTAVDLDEHGAGIGTAGPLTVHAQGLLPGERGRVRIEHESPHRPEAWGTSVGRLGPPSPDRVEPVCPGFGRCGGCVWQHLAYPAQLALKQARVRRALAGVLGEVEVAAAVAAPATTQYRNKGKYVIGAAGPRVILGAYAPRSHAVVETLGCAVVEAAIDATARALRDRLEASGLPVYDELNRTGFLRYAIARTGELGERLVVLVTTSAAPRQVLAEVASALATEATGVVWVRNDAHGGVLLTLDSELLAGDGTVREQFAGVEVDVGATDFFQVNRAQAQRLYRRVAELAGAGEKTRAADVYCGLGAISFYLAAAGARVVGLESHGGAVARANEAAARAGVADRVSFRAGDAALLGPLAAELGADLIVVNPPRKGLHADALVALIGAAPERIVYVSCGPESLGRDLVALRAAGYRLEVVEPWDLMPGTPQIETLCLLAR